MEVTTLNLVGEKVRHALNPYASFKRYLKRLRRLDGTVSNMAKLEGHEMDPIHCGFTTEGDLWVMPYKGPRITENTQLLKSLYVKKIHYDDINSCYIIELLE